MAPTPSSSKITLKPCLKRTPSGVTKTVTFSPTNSQVFFADDWDRSAVEVVSKLSYSDVLELKQLSLDSLPSDRHASMGLSPLLSHVPLTLCPVADEPKKCAESRVALPSSSPASSPLVIPDLSILASPVSTASAVVSPPSPVSSDAESSVSVSASLGSASASTSASSPESTPPKTNASLTAPVPVRRTLMMNFMPLLPEPGSELPSPVLSTSSSLSDASTDTTGKTLLQTPQTPTTPRTPHTPTSLSPIPASPTSPTSYSSPPQQGPKKSRTSRAEKAHYSALSGPASGDFGAPSPTKSAGGTASPVSPVSPASDTTVSVASGPLVRPVPRRAYAPQAPEMALVRRASVSSAPGDEPVARTKGSRGFDAPRKRLAIASSAWVDGALPDELEPAPVPRLPIEPSLRAVALPSVTPTPPRPRRSHSMNETLPTPLKYSNPYSQIREAEELGLELHGPQMRRSSSDRDVLPRIPTSSVKSGIHLPAAPHLSEGGLGLSLKTSRPPPSSMNRPTPTHRASVHGYPFSGRPPSPTPTLSRGYPSPLSPNTPLPQPRSGKPLAAKDANVRGPSVASSYTLAVDGGMGVNSMERKSRSANDLLPPSPILAPYCAPMARPKNSKVGR